MKKFRLTSFTAISSASASSSESWRPRACKETSDKTSKLSTLLVSDVEMRRKNLDLKLRAFFIHSNWTVWVKKLRQWDFGYFRTIEVDFQYSVILLTLQCKRREFYWHYGRQIKLREVWTAWGCGKVEFDPALRDSLRRHALTKRHAPTHFCIFFASLTLAASSSLNLNPAKESFFIAHYTRLHNNKHVKNFSNSIGCEWRFTKHYFG